MTSASNHASNCTVAALLNCTTDTFFNGTGNQSKFVITSPTHPRGKICDTPTQPELIGQVVFLIIILLVTLLGNSLVCTSVILYRRLRTVTNLFVVSLAVSDLLVSLLSLPFRINQMLNNSTWCNSMAMCQTWFIVDFLSTIASVWNLVMISIDRFVAIVHPFKYQTFMTKRNAFFLFGFVWLNATVWALTSLLNWTQPGIQTYSIRSACVKYDSVYYTAMSALQFFLPLLLIIFMYGNVFRVAMNQARAVAAQQTGGNRKSRRSSISIIREMKAAKTLAIVIGAFTVCWLPFFVILLISFWSKFIYNFSLTHPNVWWGVTFTFQFVLPTLNSTLNPIIYAVFNRDFRAAFKKLLAQIFRGRIKSFTNYDHSLATYTTVVDSNMKKRNGSQKTARFENYDASGETDPIDNGEESRSLVVIIKNPDRRDGKNADNGQAEHKF